MEGLKNNLTKLCSFYVSDWHLVTMILPYINQKINEQSEIITILEKDIKENIKTLLEKLNLKNEEKILNINWNKNQAIINSIKRAKDTNEIVIFINGSSEFINAQNEKLEKYLNTHYVNKKIKIVNCYEIIKYEGNINKILDEHDKVLNTSGEKDITEIFENYKRNEEDVTEKVVNI